MNTKGNTHEELRIKHREEVSTLLEPLYEPRFDDEFLTMLALMLQGKLRQEHLKDDATGQYLLEVLIMILSNQIRMRGESDKVSWWLNEELTELVGEASRELDWGKFTTLAAEAL